MNITYKNTENYCMLEVEYCFKLHPGSTNNIRKSNNKDIPQGDKDLLHWSHRHVPVSVMAYIFTDG